MGKMPGMGRSPPGGVSGPLAGSTARAPSGSWRSGGAPPPGMPPNASGHSASQGFGAGRGRGGVLGAPRNPPAPGERPTGFFERYSVAGPAMQGDRGASAAFLPGVKRYSRQAMLAVYRSIKKDGRLQPALAEDIPGLTTRDPKPPLAEMATDAAEEAALEAGLRGTAIPGHRSGRRYSSADVTGDVRGEATIMSRLTSKLTDTPEEEATPDEALDDSIEPGRGDQKGQAPGGGDEPPATWLAEKFGAMGMGMGMSMLGVAEAPSGNSAALDGALEEGGAGLDDARFEDAQDTVLLGGPRGTPSQGMPAREEQPRQPEQSAFSFAQSTPDAVPGQPAPQQPAPQSLPPEHSARVAVP